MVCSTNSRPLKKHVCSINHPGKLVLFEEHIDPPGKWGKGCSWKKRKYFENRLGGCFTDSSPI